MRGHLVQVGGGDVGGVVTVAAVRLGKAVHVQQLPVGHLAVGVEHLLTSADRPDAHHFKAVLGEEEGRGRESERKREINLSFCQVDLCDPPESVGLTGVNSRLAL